MIFAGGRLSPGLAYERGYIMPITSNLRGKNCMVYPFTFTEYPQGTSINKTAILSIIENGTPFKYFLGVPETIRSNWDSLPRDIYLYDKPTAPTLPASFNQETAALFDVNLPGWQLQSILVYSGDGYTGAVNKSECIGLFPNALNITSFIDDPDFRGFIFHFPDLDYALDLHRNNPTTETLSSDSRLYDLMGSGSYGTQLFSSLYFKSGISCATVQTGYVPERTAFGQYFTLHSGISQMQDSVFYSNKGFGAGVPEYFFRSLEPDFVPPHSEIPDDPYNPGGESGTGGGTGDFDGTGDDIDIPGLPSLSAVDTGFITLFNPSAGQLKNLANYMWSNGFDLDTFKKLFADPMDCVLGLSIVPVAVPNGGSKTVNVGNISTDIAMTAAASQYVEVDCGTLNVNEFWGAYLDYDPYTKAEIYLPYIGAHPLAVDDIMGKPVHVVYHVDILSGACTAFVKCGGSVLYEFIGQCSSSIPITGNDWTNVINGVISIAGAIGSMVATGGASAPMALGSIASTAVNSMKPNVEKSGSMSGTGGMLAVQTPYLILTRPRQALPSGQNSFMGYPSFITENLGSLSGYTEIESVHLEGISATEQEISEIETLLKTGVIF